MPGSNDAYMVWASSFASAGDFLLRLAICQGEELIPESRRAAPATRRFSRRSALTSAGSRRGGPLLARPRRPGCRGPGRSRPGAVAHQHTLSRLQLTELARQLFALRIYPRERLAEPLFLLSNLIQCRHSVPSRRSIG